MNLRPEVSIYLGDVEASREPLVVKTLLGSCVAACLWDPVARVGGMNHFMLPEPTKLGAGDDPARFGVHAMDLLIGEIQKLGGQRPRLQAKIFGGGHVLVEQRLINSVPQKNIAFIRKFVAEERIQVVGEDLGGTTPRHVHFCTDNGKAFVRRLGAKALVAPLREKRVRPPPPAYGTVELF